MKKKLNIEQVTNELRGGSAFFPSYKNAQNDQVSEKLNVSPTSSHQEPIQPKGEIQQHQTNSQIPERANVPTPARPNVRRIITRNSFETYEDQMESLRKLSY